jgi:hypothetical protein
MVWILGLLLSAAFVPPEGALADLAAESGADAVCELRFIAGARRAEQIEVRCSEGAGEAAREAVAAQIDWRRGRALDNFSRGRPVRDHLDLDVTEDGHWQVRPELLFRVPPQYPAREAARAATANCRVRYDIVDGTADVHGTHCITDGSDRAFGQAARQAVERWIYTRNSNRRCVLVTLEFGLQDPGTERFGTEDAPEDPPCPYED